MLPIEDAHLASAISGPVRGAILSAILRRQALRREAQLPLLDVRAEYERAVTQARWRAHVETYGEAIRAQVYAELRAKQGPHFRMSVGGMWAVRLLTAKRLRDGFGGETLSLRSTPLRLKARSRQPRANPGSLYRRLNEEPDDG